MDHLKKAMQDWMTRDSETRAREANKRFDAAAVERAMMKMQQEKAAYAAEQAKLQSQQLAAMQIYGNTYGQQVLGPNGIGNWTYGGNTSVAQGAYTGYGTGIANIPTVTYPAATVMAAQPAQWVSTIHATQPGQWNLIAGGTGTQYMPYNNFEPPKPKPALMEPAFSLDELEAAQDFIDSMGAA